MKCPQCGFNLPDDSLFCLACGSRVGPSAGVSYADVPFGTILICPGCGQKNMRTDRWCRKCDKDLTEAKRWVSVTEPKGIDCPQCNTTNPARSRYCRKCGYEIAPARQEVIHEQEIIKEREIVLIKCPYCGNLSPQGTLKCSSCGGRL